MPTMNVSLSIVLDFILALRFRREAYDCCGLLTFHCFLEHIHKLFPLNSVESMTYIWI